MNLGNSAIALADETQLRDVIDFDIAAQPLDKALDAFGNASGIQIFYETSVTAGHRSTAVKGTLAPMTALRTLLRETGLTARVIVTGWC